MKCNNLKCNKHLSKYQEKDKYLFCSRSCANIARPRNKPESNIKRSLTLRKIFPVNKTCPVCNTMFTTLSRKISCSKKCQAIQQSVSLKSNVSAMNNLRNGARTRINKRYAAGDTSIGWQSRSGSSYPEQFFEKALTDRNISFEREVRVGRWFVDFMLPNKNALEIDGRQHEDRIEKDAKKDLFLIENGYKVTRIKWKGGRGKGLITMFDQLNIVIKYIRLIKFRRF